MDDPLRVSYAMNYLPFPFIVLILVVMDDPLRDKLLTKEDAKEFVLILVVMDDPLRALKD